MSTCNLEVGDVVSVMFVHGETVTGAIRNVLGELVIGPNDAKVVGDDGVLSDRVIRVVPPAAPVSESQQTGGTNE